MMRSHGIGTTELGVWLGTIYGLAGVGSILFGGYVATRWFANNERGQMRVSAIAVGLTVPYYVCMLLLSNVYAALLMLIPVYLALNFFCAPCYALMQRLVPDDVRATSMAIIMLLYNLIGLGLAPLIVGMLSDRLAPALKGESLRYAMLIMTLVGFWAAYHLWQVGKSVQNDLASIDELCARVA
jgi:hypothetical protein